MNSRNLGLLAGLAAAAVALALWISFGPGNNYGPRQSGEALFPGLGDRLLSVEGITLTGPQGTATLVRRLDQWVVEERFGYRADRDQIRALFAGLVRARRLEPKTADDKRLQSIGLGESAESLTLAASDGSVIAALRIGTTRTPVAGAERKTFVWAADDRRSWLVSSIPALTTSPILWLDQEIISLSNVRISGVSIIRADDDNLSLSGRANNVAALELEGQSAGETLIGATANETMTVLSSLRFDDVAPPSQIAGPEVATARYSTLDGLIVEVRIREAAAGGTWAIFSAEYDESVSLSEESPDLMPDAPADGAAEAAALNAGWGGWIFRLSDTDAEALTRPRSAVVATAEED